MNTILAPNSVSCLNVTVIGLWFHHRFWRTLAIVWAGTLISRR
jgi:hypothetical protein